MATYNHFYELPVYKVCRAFRKKVAARGSLSETLEHIITAYDEKYITKEILSDLNKDYKVCLKELNTYIKYLKTAKIEARNNN